MNTRQLIKYINDIIDTIPIVHSFNDVDPYTYWNSQEVKYGSVIFAVRGNTQVGAVNRYNCIMYYGDRVLKDESNVNDIYADAQGVIKHVINNINLSDANMSVIEGSPVVTFFRQRFLDDLAGGYCIFTIEDAEIMGACGYNNGNIVEPDAPIDYDRFSFNIVATPDDSTIIINGEERSGIIAVKGTLIEWSVSHPNYVTQTGALRLTDDTLRQVDLEEVRYDFTINPTPSDALVIINDEPRKTIRLKYGDVVSWSVSKVGFEPQTGTHIVTGDYVQNVNLEAVKHTFTINPTPADATVIINGVQRTSITADYGTPISWSVSREGYTSRNGTSVIGLVDETINVGLVINQYTFTVVPTPATAIVTINGERRTSITADYGTPISWSVGVYGYITQSGNTILNDDLTVSVVLEKAKYEFSIEATPADATVTINGQERTSITADFETPINWSVEKEGYVAQSGTLNLTSNFKQIVNLAILQCTFQIFADDIFTVIINGEERRSITVDYGTLVTWSVSADHYQTVTGSETLYEDSGVHVMPHREQYTFTINPTPADATVIINDQERNSITVPYENIVTWSVSKEGYDTQSGSEKMVENKTMNVNLSIQQFTFAISATPPDATVIINGQNQSSVVVNYGDRVTWEVSRNGYHTQGSSRVVTGDITWVVNLVPESYEYVINPTPSDATILINGFEPIPGQHTYVDYGSYVEWSVSREGYVTQSGRDYITGPVTKNINLVRQQYTFSIDTDPANTVIINDVQRTSITADFETPITWSVSRTGYEAQSGSYTLTGNYTETIQLVLSQYTFSIDTDPSNTVIINGLERTSITDIYGTNIIWSVSKTDYETQSGSFVLDGDYTMNINLESYREKYLTFEILSDGDIKWSSGYALSVGKTIYYKKNNEEWTAITTKPSPQYSQIDVVAGDIIQFRGNNNAYGSHDPVYGSEFGGTARCIVSGNIMSLIDSVNYKTLDTFSSNHVFRYLFADTQIVDASNLILPATTLTVGCYMGMFLRCPLTSTPKLPATTMVQLCYNAMFNGCTELTAAPVLPATTLANNCYSEMFGGCASLTTAPELPATTLASNCYEAMFSGCTSLTTAPELPATNLEYRCYRSMFAGCLNLNFIDCRAVISDTATDYTINWVYMVASTGTFVKSPNTTWVVGDDGIPSGWSVIDAT